MLVNPFSSAATVHAACGGSNQSRYERYKNVFFVKMVADACASDSFLPSYFGKYITVWCDLYRIAVFIIVYFAFILFTRAGSTT